MRLSPAVLFGVVLLVGGAAQPAMAQISIQQLLPIVTQVAGQYLYARPNAYAQPNYYGNNQGYAQRGRYPSNYNGYPGNSYSYPMQNYGVTNYTNPQSLLPTVAQLAAQALLSGNRSYGGYPQPGYGTSSVPTVLPYVVQAAGQLLNQQHPYPAQPYSNQGQTYYPNNNQSQPYNPENP